MRSGTTGPASPNIISCTALASQFHDDDGTNIQTYRTHSIFTWDSGPYHRTFYHPPGSNIPELGIGAGFSAFNAFCARIQPSASEPPQPPFGTDHNHHHPTQTSQKPMFWKSIRTAKVQKSRSAPVTSFPLHPSLLD